MPADSDDRKLSNRLEPLEADRRLLQRGDNFGARRQIIAANGAFTPRSADFILTRLGGNGRVHKILRETTVIIVLFFSRLAN